MAATHQKHYEYSSNVVRTLSPTQRTSNVDNNLDYLLEDLQSSVSSPVSYTSSTARDVQYLSPANTTTVVRERSVSPGSGTRKVYKASSYQYSTTGGADSLGTQQNANQLDTLLQDLKTERDITRERDYSHLHTSGIDSGLLEPTPGSGGVTKTTRIYKTSVTDNKPSAQRELLFDSFDDSFSQGTSPKPSPTTTGYMKKVESKTVRDVAYEPGSTYNIKRTEQRILSPSDTTKTLSVRTSDEFPPELKDVTLSDDILPVPGTKVTTTVRTYTYEIPGDVPSTTNNTLLYKNEASYNSSSNKVYPERNVPQSVVFKTESYNTVDSSMDGGPPSPRNIPPPSGQTSSRTVIHKRDVRETNTSNVYPPPGDDYPPARSPTSPPNSSTYVYKKDVTNTTNIVPGEPNWDSRHPKLGFENAPGPGYPPGHPPGHPGHPGHPGGPTTTYYYKHESSNTKNTLYGPPSDGGSPYPSPRGEPLSYSPTGSSPGYRPGPPYPNEPDGPRVTTYKYSEKHNSSTTRGHPSEREPLLQPAPFPTDLDHSQTNGNPPKRLDDLMATFNGNAGGVPVDETMSRKKEVETAVAQSGEPKIPSKNVAGPPVYYPPGQEMFMKKEESNAAWRAQGGYAKASGGYEYEAESKSKSKSRSGAAVVPVCLPLCCAMPCTIM